MGCLTLETDIIVACFSLSVKGRVKEKSSRLITEREGKGFVVLSPHRLDDRPHWPREHGTS